MTDPQGKVSADVLPGTTVTLVGYRAPGDWVSTFDVRPGDSLTYDEEPGCAPSQGTMTVTVPAFAGAFHYEVRAGDVSAQASDTSIALTDSGCLGSTFDMLVIASDRYSWPVAYMVQRAVQFSAGGTLSLNGAAWTPFSNYSVAYTDHYPGTVQVSLDLRIGSRLHPLQQIDGGRSFTNLGEGLSLPLVNYGDPVLVGTEVEIGGPPEQFIYNSYHRGVAASLAISPNLLPWIANGKFDRTGRLITWETKAPGPVEPDGIVVRALFKTAFEEHWWTMIAPAKSGLVLPFPPLPNPVSSVYPMLLESSDYADYAELRNARLMDVIHTVNGQSMATRSIVSYGYHAPDSAIGH